MKKKTGIFLVFVILSISEGALIADDASTIRFSGYTWIVKDAQNLRGPGPNRFSRTAVYMDDDDLIMQITPKGNRWVSSEIFSTDYFGYGRYDITFSVPWALDSQGVFGFFLYNDSKPPHFNEIDFEISRWGFTGNPPYSFTVQPYTKDRHSTSFRGVQQGTFTCTIDWTSDAARFRLTTERNLVVKEWVYRGDSLPRNTESRVHINLWLFNGSPPKGDGDLEITVHSFSYLPRF